jgi:hypothetical protein
VSTDPAVTGRSTGTYGAKGSSPYLSKRRLLRLASGCVVLIAGGVYMLRRGISGAQEDSPRRSSAAIQAAIDRHIRDSTARANQTAASRAEQLAAFVRKKKDEGLKGFSEDVTSYRSSWLAIKTKLPFTDSEEHRRFVVEAFDKRLFSPTQLRDTIAQIVGAFDKDLVEEQNKLAVSLRQEIQGGPVAAIGAPGAQQEMQKAVATATGSARSQATKAIGDMVVSETVAAIVSLVLTRLGVTLSIISAGASTSWWSLGAGLAIGLAVDAAVRYFRDPAKDVSTDVGRSLDEFATHGKDLLKQELERAVSERAQVWAKAAKGMLS